MMVLTNQSQAMYLARSVWHGGTQCACYIVQVVESILAFSTASLARISQCVTSLVSLDDMRKEIASEFGSTAGQSAGYHRLCYQKFTDKTRI